MSKDFLRAILVERATTRSPERGKFHLMPGPTPTESPVAERASVHGLIVDRRTVNEYVPHSALLLCSLQYALPMDKLA